MQIIGLQRHELAPFTAQQLKHFFPVAGEDFTADIDRHLDVALARLQVCIDSVRMWRPGCFDVFHSSQYCSYLYLLARTVWVETQDRRLPTRLFALNKALNGIDLFYEIEMPQRFFIGHSVGIVLAKATYGDCLVLYQNSTVGKNNGQAPVLGEGCILYPNSAVLGQSRLGPDTTLAQGASLIDASTDGSCIVFRRDSGALIKPVVRRYVEDYFRLG